jgi:hypothetical protein
MFHGTGAEATLAGSHATADECLGLVWPGAAEGYYLAYLGHSYLFATTCQGFIGGNQGILGDTVAGIQKWPNRQMSLLCIENGSSQSITLRLLDQTKSAGALQTRELTT